MLHICNLDHSLPPIIICIQHDKVLKLARSGSTSANICNFMKTEYSKVWDKNFTIFKWLLLQRVICRNFWGQGWHDQKIARSGTHIKSSSAITVCLAKKFYIFQFTWQTYHTDWQLSLISFSLLTWALTLAPISGVTFHHLDWFQSVWFCDILIRKYNSTTTLRWIPPKSGNR